MTEFGNPISIYHFHFSLHLSSFEAHQDPLITHQLFFNLPLIN